DFDRLALARRVLHERDEPRGHESSRPDRRPAARHLGHLDDAAGRRHLDAPAVARRHDVERLDGATGIDDDLDAVALHATARCLSGTPLPPYRSATISARM